MLLTTRHARRLLQTSCRYLRPLSASLTRTRPRLILFDQPKRSLASVLDKTLSQTIPEDRAMGKAVSASVVEQAIIHQSEHLTPTHVAEPVPIPARGVDHRGKVVLAPMVRSGELPCRLTALNYGADLVWGPETVDRSMIGTVMTTNPRTGCYEWHRSPTQHAHSKPQIGEDGEAQNLIFRIHPDETSRFVYQIGTNDPGRAVECSKLIAPYCAEVGVNAGCPKSFSTDGGMGAELLTKENGDLLCRILVALVKEIGIPHEIGISVKIRLLSTPEETAKLVHKLCKTGITGLTIHCRTRPMRPRERAIRTELKMIGAICRSYGVACLMNGDVISRDEGLRLAKEYGVDGCMIATAAEANPSVFLPESAPKVHWKDVTRQYLGDAIAVENRMGNTKFSLSQIMNGKDKVYQAIVQSRTYEAMVQALGFDNLLEKAREVDRVLKLDVPVTTRADIKRANKAAARAQHEANRAKKEAKAVAEKKAHEERTDKKRQRSSTPDGRTDRDQKRKVAPLSDTNGFEENKAAELVAAT